MQPRTPWGKRAWVSLDEKTGPSSFWKQSFLFLPYLLPDSTHRWSRESFGPFLCNSESVGPFLCNQYEAIQLVRSQGAQFAWFWLITQITFPGAHKSISIPFWSSDSSFGSFDGPQSLEDIRITWNNYQKMQIQEPGQTGGDLDQGVVYRPLWEGPSLSPWLWFPVCCLHYFLLSQDL